MTCMACVALTLGCSAPPSTRNAPPATQPPPRTAQRAGPQATSQTPAGITTQPSPRTPADPAAASKAGISHRQLAPSRSSNATGVWPTKGWRTSAPEEQGMDAGRLADMLDSARAQGLSLHSVLVIRHGFIVMEKYFGSYDAGTAHSLYSVTKSFVSALVGIAIRKGLISGVSHPVMGYFPSGTFTGTASAMMSAPQAQVQEQAQRARQPRQVASARTSSPFGPGAADSQASALSKGSITVEDLLTMSSGLGWLEADETYERMYTSSRDWVKFVLDTPMATQPGQSFNYSSGNSHLLSAIVQKTSRMNTYDFAQANLFRPLGIKDPDWDRDPSGIPIGGWGLTLTPRDMAKLGYLYLHGGKWEERQVVPASWVRASTEAHIRIDDMWQYGYQWWLDPGKAYFAAIGRYGQTILVVPAQDLVVVFTAHIDSNDSEVDLARKYIIPACASSSSSDP